MHWLAELTARSPREAGYSSRVSRGTFVWAKVMEIQKACKADKSLDVRKALTRLRTLLEAGRSSC